MLDVELIVNKRDETSNVKVNNLMTDIDSSNEIAIKKDESDTTTTIKFMNDMKDKIDDNILLKLQYSKFSPWYIDNISKDIKLNVNNVIDKESILLKD